VSPASTQTTRLHDEDIHVVNWRKASRTLTDDEIDVFYNKPLSRTTVFNFQTDKMRVPAKTAAFSLKFVLAGRETYRFANRNIALAPGQFLFLNAGESYASAIDSPTRSVSIFLSGRDEDELLRSVLGKRESVIESEAGRHAAFEAPQVAFSRASNSEQDLPHHLAAINACDPEAAREHAQLLVMDALHALLEIAPHPVLAQYAKRATRDELLQRLLRARSIIHDSAGRFDDLDRLSEEACLSKFYFLRLFRDAFGLPPGAYARRVRLQAAIAEIARGKTPELAMRRAGYTDRRAFRRACYRNNITVAGNSQF